MDHEELFLRSLDFEVSEREKKELALALEQNRQLRQQSTQVLKLRELLLRRESDSFGPFFAERIIHQIKMMKKEIDYQIFFFFKKYQLIAAGIVIALLTVNILLSDQLSVKSILGIDEDTVEDVITIDLYKNLTE